MTQIIGHKKNMREQIGSFKHLVRSVAIMAFLVALCGVAGTGPVVAVVQSQNIKLDETRDPVEAAREALAARDHETAIAYLTRLTGAGGASRVSYLLLSEAYILAGSGVAAEAAILRARELGADFATTAILLSKSKILQGKPEDVLSSLRGVPLKGDDRAEALVVQGDAEMALGDDFNAEALYREAQGLIPDRFEPVLGRARIAMQRDAFDEARELAIKAEKLEPQNTMVQYTLGLLDKYQGAADGGRARFESAVAFFEENLLARLEIASLDIDAGDLEAAEAQLDVVFEQSTNNDQAVYLSALIAAQRGQFADAHRLFNRISTTVQNYLPGLYVRSMVAYETGANEIAVDSLRRVLQARPANRRARLTLISTYLRLNRPDLASEILAPMLASGVPDAETLTLAAATSGALGNMAQSADYLERAEALQVAKGESTKDLSEDFSVRLALARFTSGDQQAAISTLAGAINNDIADIDRLGLLASMQHDSGDLVSAEKTANRMVGEAPERALGYNILGTIKFTQRQFADAKIFFTSAIERREDYLSARRNRALASWRLGELAEAAQDVRRILDITPNDARSKALLGRLLLDQEQFEAAIEPLYEAFRDLPRSRDLAVDLAVARAGAGDTSQAIRDARLALRMVGSRPDLLRRIGLMLLAINEPSIASGPLQRYQAYYPSRAEASLLYGRALFASGLYTGAAASFERALRYADGEQQQEALWYLFANNVRRGEATRALRKLSDLDKEQRPADIASTIVGEAYQQIGEDVKAIEIFETSYASKPDSATARALATALWRTGEKDGAIRILERHLERGESGRRTYALLGDLRIEQGDYDAAAEAYETALSRAGVDARLLSKLSMVYLRLGKYQAVELAERAYLIAPEDPSILDVYGWVLLQGARQVTEAIGYLERAVKRDPGVALYRYHLGMAYLAANKIRDARRSLTEALSLGQDFAGAEDAQQQLNRIR